ncbi:MAG: hypothetical protein IIX77_05770 [Oscillospiraceae bacterium]|jgi:hypothetical protein|nr:hypothetical protein [Oscillospiraceae bacterium]
MSEYQYGASEPMLLYCTDEYGDPVCFELIAQLTHDDGNEYALLGIKDDALGGPLSPISTLVVKLGQDGTDTVMDPVEDSELENELYDLFENMMYESDDFS